MLTPELRRLFTALSGELTAPALRHLAHHFDINHIDVHFCAVKPSHDTDLDHEAELAWQAGYEEGTRDGESSGYERGQEENQKTIDDLEDRLSKLDDEHNDVIGERDDLQAEIRSLESRISDLESELNSLR